MDHFELSHNGIDCSITVFGIKGAHHTERQISLVCQDQSNPDSTIVASNRVSYNPKAFKEFTFFNPIKVLPVKNRKSPPFYHPDWG